MATARHPSLAEYERTLRAALLDERIHIRWAEMDDAAGKLLPDVPKVGHFTFLVDTFEAGACQVVVHELWHLVYWSKLESWGKLHEPYTETAERELHVYINHSKRRRKWWREAIKAKVEQEDDD